MKSARLVYQAGIANVFELDENDSVVRRLLQHDFRTCEAYARGLQAAGVNVNTSACNRAGDIAEQPWSDELDEQPFSAEFRPVFSI